ncbi:MAG: hypothetical protein ACFFCZ_17965 [Promethearchaeota archaeon]
MPSAFITIVSSIIVTFIALILRLTLLAIIFIFLGVIIAIYQIFRGIKKVELNDQGLLLIHFPYRHRISWRVIQELTILHSTFVMRAPGRSDFYGLSANRDVLYSKHRKQTRSKFLSVSVKTFDNNLLSLKFPFGTFNRITKFKDYISQITGIKPTFEGTGSNSINGNVTKSFSWHFD